MVGEGDPTRDIVDAQTFGLWFVGYRRQLREKTNSFTTSDKMLIYPGKRPLLSLFACPWEEVPEDIAGLVALPYDAALVDGKKSVDVVFGDGNIFLTLNSPQVEGKWDKHGQNFVGSGLTLNVGSKRSEDIKPGDWTYTKIPASLAVELGQNPADMLSFERRIKKLSLAQEARNSRPATLSELHSMANFLQGSSYRSMLLLDFFSVVSD